MSYNFNAAEVFRIAIAIEENGKRFYDESLKVVDDPEVKKLFVELAEQEVEHKKRFEALKAALPPEAARSTVWDPDNEMDMYIKMMADQHVFVKSSDVEEQLAKARDVKSALKLAIEFEKDSVLFFLGLEGATETAKDRDLIMSLVKEEQEHLRRLSLQLNRLRR